MSTITLMVVYPDRLLKMADFDYLTGALYGHLGDIVARHSSEEKRITPIKRHRLLSRSNPVSLGP